MNILRPLANKLQSLAESLDSDEGNYMANKFRTFADGFDDCVASLHEDPHVFHWGSSRFQHLKCFFTFLWRVILNVEARS